MAEQDEDDLDRLDPSALRRSAAAVRTPKKDEDESNGDVPAVKRIDIDMKDTRGKHHEGFVVFRVPTIGMQIEIGNLKATMMPGGVPSDGDASGLMNEMLCYLEVCLDKKQRPDWWKPHRFYDASILSFVYAQARAHHARFLGHAEIDGDDAGSTGEGRDDDGRDALERDLQPPAERRETLVSHSDRGARAGQRKSGPGADQG